MVLVYCLLSVLNFSIAFEINISIKALFYVLTPLLQAAELFEVTQDPDWVDPSCAIKEENIPALLKELTVSFSLKLN